MFVWLRWCLFCPSHKVQAWGIVIHKEAYPCQGKSLLGGSGAGVLAVMAENEKFTGVNNPGRCLGNLISVGYEWRREVLSGGWS
ncbi:unnamed protein product [Protopolystoma xenopodis]|uniref:Peptidase S9 prolyl oligopeptidase catalytic domain-containing protein n=1 Tax=Protopolystoma xenopodis TaxID=117903 RepID=A0A3S5BQY9_9PLAT|nr:unnamed protein product [Protopolystoma xenopodis]